MTFARVVLLCLIPALMGTALHAQDDKRAKRTGELSINYVVAEDAETHWDIWREGDDGPFVLALPFAVEMRYTDNTDNDDGLKRELILLADVALVWFEPGDDGGDIQGDPFLAMSKGATSLQFYGEGHIWMKYTVGRQSVTVRADRIFLDFARSKVVTFDSAGREVFTEELNLQGIIDNPRAHSGYDESGTPGEEGDSGLGTGIGLGEDAEEAGSEGEEIGAAPNEDAIPERAGRPKSLPVERGSRFFLRASQLRILSLNSEEQEIELEEGSVSSSSLAVASYSIYADFLTIRLTKRRGTVYATRPAIRILDYPILQLDVEDYAYDIDSQPPIRQLEFISDNRFGFGFRTYIDAVATYDFFVDPEPPFHPLQLGPQIDYYSKRGLATGVNLDWGYTRALSDFGRAHFRSIYINDPGDDRARARELGWFPVEKHSRGRINAAYSQGFGDGWQLDHHLSYASDQFFRREFYEPEYDNNELEVSFIRLTKRYGGLNAFLHIQPKVHPWLSQTEYLPTLGFVASRVPIGDFGLQLTSHTDVSVLRFQPGDLDEAREDEEVSTIRADTETYMSLPFELGPFAFDPYVGLRFTGASSHVKFPEGNPRPGLSDDKTFAGMRTGDQEQTGILYRFIPFFGANFQTFFTGVFPDVQIPGLGIDGLRHVFAPFVRYRNDFYNSLDDIDGRGFIPLDNVDVLDENHEIRVGFRNRLQTRAGWGEDRRTIDYFEVMVELPIYPQRKRDNGGDLFGDLEIASVWRPAPGFAIAGNMFIDMQSGNFNRAAASFNFDIFNIGEASIYYRLLKDEHQVVGIRANLRVSELYRIGVKQEYDMQAGKLRDTRVTITRRILEALDVGVTFTRDPVEGHFGFYLSLTAAFSSPSSSSLFR